jgi:FMN phosphatase YigB (HAD superfamily)
VLDGFDTVYASCVAGLRKPDLIHDIGITNEPTLFIDNSVKNVAAARSLGCYTWLYRSSELHLLFDYLNVTRVDQIFRRL